jgi:aspartyl-tRNA(Asn)/glutamyl-tRNA(Gln) amidotransferase subunit A
MSSSWHEAPGHVIRDAVVSGDTSAVAVAQSYLDRIAHVDGQIQSYVEVWQDHALEQAEALDSKIKAGDDPGALAGVPIALKDLLCTTHGTTTCASQILKGYKSPFDATVVARLAQEGAVFLGKTNMDEFAMGSSTENSSIRPTRNPWNVSCVPGGSSGGSAAAVSADLCAMSLGSDTGGSIRQPASFCGCIGMKPTYGRVSRYGLVAFASSLDQIGPFTKDVEDCALILNSLCGRDEYDATSSDIPVPDFTKALNDGVDGLTIGLPKEYFTDDLSAEMRESVMAAVGILEGQGAKIVEVSLPHTRYAVAVYYIICTAEASANLARFDGVRYGNRSESARDVQDMYHRTKSEGFGTEVQRRILLGTYVLSSGYYDAYYLKGQKARSLVRRDFVEAFKSCDIIATPTCPTPAFEFGAKSDNPLEMYLNDIFTSTANLSGGPGLSMPCGLSKDGLPMGLQLIGKDFDEATMLRAARTYEAHCGDGVGRPALTCGSGS